MLENLFSSRVLFDVLVFLFKNKDKKSRTSEIIEATGKNQANVMRSLEKLAAWGFVKKEKLGNASVFGLNQGNKHFAALESLFESHRSSGRSYFLVNEEGGVSLLAWHYFVSGFTDQRVVEYGYLKDIKPSFIHVKNGYGCYYKDKAAWQVNSKAALERLLADSSIVNKLALPVTMGKGERAFEINDHLRNNLEAIDRQEAVRIIDEFADIIATQIVHNHIAVMDLIDHPLSNYLKNYIDKRILGTDHNSSVVIEKLLMPTKLTNTQKMKRSLLGLAISNMQNGATDTSALEAIWHDWKWLNYGYRGPVLEFEYFKQMLSELERRTIEECQKELRQIDAYEEDVAARKRELYRELKIDRRHVGFIEALSILSFLKVYRKDISFLLIYLTHQILERFNDRYKSSHLHNMTLDEAKLMILGKLELTERELAAREKGCIYRSHDRAVLVGESAKKYMAENIDDSKEEIGDGIRQLDGTMACLGKTGNWVYGTVRIINNPEDMAKMQEGDILVSVATTPDILPAMKKAAAIVTDHGGITCHAAIVSRELNIPCLIATKYATKVFKDGDRVVMCPRHGYIKFQ